MDELVDRLRHGQWTAGVVGLGYVGLPLAMSAARAGLPVVGFDIAGERVTSLRDGRSHVGDVSDAELMGALSGGAVFTDDPSELGSADAIFISVPSPLGRNRQPDMSYIDSAAETVAKVART